MALDLVQLRVLAQKKEEENWAFRQFLKTRCNLEPEEIDHRVATTTESVWAGINCTQCANCCREVRPTFSEEEVGHLAVRLRMTPQQFVETYLEHAEPGDENPWQTRSAPCPFLKDKRCSVYENRPADCRGYPYLYEPEFVFRIMGMIERTSTCPIVYEVMEDLKRSLGFARRRRQCPPRIDSPRINSPLPG
jgi:hypothetical protein